MGKQQADPGDAPRRLIAGSGRSGTTWILDCLAEANGLRPIFEPLHPLESELGARYANQAVTPTEDLPDLERLFAELAAGRLSSRWTDYRGSTPLLFPKPGRFATPGFPRRWVFAWRKYLRNRKQFQDATKRGDTLIKCIRANLMLGWLTGKARFRVALVVRHPCAAVESQYRFAANWDRSAVFSRYSRSSRFREVTAGRYDELLNSDLDTIQSLTLAWVIENQLPVERSVHDGYRVFYYEDLVDNGHQAWAPLCQSLGLAKIPDERLLRKPSQMASWTKAGEGGGNTWSEPRWKKTLDADQLGAIQAILDETGCDLYTTRDNEPKRGIKSA